MKVRKNHIERGIYLIAYNGFDSAASAAAMLQKYPEAEVYVTSAARIAETLSLISGNKCSIHILGIGARCDPQKIGKEVNRITKGGGTITWYAKGDYLKHIIGIVSDRVKFVINGSKLLPEIVVEENGIDSEYARELVRLTRESISSVDISCKNQLIQLIDASISYYLKFRDHDAVPAAIRTIANPDARLSAADHALIHDYLHFGNRFLAGNSPVLTNLRDVIRKIGKDRNCTVLITGETGTGKGVVAELIHQCSPRRGMNFVEINCPAIPETLAESSLFGYEKGSHSEAKESTEGILKKADGGTVFFDEVGDLTLSIQAKLLKLLDSKKIIKVGGKKEEKIDVRFIFATNKNLLSLVKQGKFREDLYYRIMEVNINVPPLREHKEDIPIIAGEIIRRECMARQRDVPDFTDQEIMMLKTYHWPGNVRELEKVLKNYIIMGELKISNMDMDSKQGSEGITCPAPTAEKLQVKESKFLTLKEMELKYIKEVLEATGWNKAKAARILGIDRNTLAKKIKKIK